MFRALTDTQFEIVHYRGGGPGVAAILSNAEAAQKMLQRDPVDLAELREICDDIVTEDHRAAEVIRRLGALFKRGSPKLAPLDLNELVRDTLDLVRTNLLTRQVTVSLEPGPELPSVDGDRVQLQQLLLNLIVNAADAMDATPQAGRPMTAARQAPSSSSGASAGTVSVPPPASQVLRGFT